ncbi:MAG TPA: type II secretion system F family protein [Candidatus Nanoarchaeia archaeon]|nr:type II secretion system F family protein [Candidatus Nanoarchaeia archaeon]
MKFHIPFTLTAIERLKVKSKPFANLISRKKESGLQQSLKSVEAAITREEYLGIVLRGLLIRIVIGYVFISTIFFFAKVTKFYIWAAALTLACAGFIAFSQMLYPKVYASRRERDIERNLIPALEDMLVQLNSGVPLYNILVNISASDYGELSSEFKKAVKKINAGSPQSDVLDELGKRNGSQFLRRTLWQISNGMKAGSDIAIVIRESRRSLGEEQILQIQSYGNKLNPLIMFYMLISVILPALSITFLTVISSLVGLGKSITIGLFVGLFGLVVLIQITFLGMMRSMRPSLF